MSEPEDSFKELQAQPFYQEAIRRLSRYNEAVRLLRATTDRITYIEERMQDCALGQEIEAFLDAEPKEKP